VLFLVPWLLRNISELIRGGILRDIPGILRALMTGEFNSELLPDGKLFGSLWLIIIMSDYISLLFVREFLNMARVRPTTSGIISSAIGLVVVIASFVTFNWFMSDILYSGAPIAEKTEALYLPSPHSSSD
jgi:hypothetical protein